MTTTEQLSSRMDEINDKTGDGVTLYEGDTFECPYCNADVPAELYDAVPDVGDDAAWAKLADAHSANGCEWVETRAHRI